MFYFLIVVLFTVLAFVLSVPIANSFNLSYITIFTDWFSYLIFSGVMSGIILIIARQVTRFKFNPNSKLFYVSEIEQRFYKKIRLDDWKHLIPDCGNFVDFKKKIDYRQSKKASFYEKFLYENINASILHFFAVLTTPISLIFIHNQYFFTIGVFGFLMMFILNMMPVMLQKSIRPRLLKLYNKLKTREIEESEEVIYARY